MILDGEFRQTVLFRGAINLLRLLRFNTDQTGKRLKGVLHHHVFTLVVGSVVLQQAAVEYQFNRAMGWQGWSVFLLSTLSSMGVMLALFSWARLSSGRVQTALYSLFTFAVTLITYIDILYFRQFGDLPSVASARFADQLSVGGSAVVSLMRWTDVAYCLPALFILELLLTPREVRNDCFRVVRMRTVALCVTVGALISGAVASTVPKLPAVVRTGGQIRTAVFAGVPTFHLIDAGGYILHQIRAKRLTPEEVSEVTTWLDSHHNAANSKQSTFGIARGKNVIVLQVESLQAFVLGLSFDGKQVTPNLNRIAKQSLRFTNFYHQTGQGVTSDAELLGNCSLLPLPTGAVYYDYASNDFSCMPKLARSAGYSTVAIHGYQRDFWNRSAVYPKIGFQHFYSSEELDQSAHLGMGISDDSVLQQAVKKIKAMPEPSFAFIVTLSSHTPFKDSRIPRELILGSIEGTKTAEYIHAIHYADAAIGDFIATLDKEGLLDRTVLVIYGDHSGVLRGVPGLAEVTHLAESDETEWTRVEKRVPLMIRLPHHAGNRAIDDPAGELDIAPTLAGLLGLRTDSTAFLGRDLFSTQMRPVPFQDGSAADSRSLYLAASNKCLSWETGKSFPLNECAPMRLETDRLRKIDSNIIEGNYVKVLSQQ